MGKSSDRADPAGMANVFLNVFSTIFNTSNEQDNKMKNIYQNRQESLTLKITKDNRSPLHMHRQVEIFYVLDGQIDITVGSQIRSLTKGMISVAFPDVIHRTNTPEHSEALMLIFDPDMLPDFYQEFATLLPKEAYLTDTAVTRSLYQHLSAAHGCIQRGGDLRMAKGYLILFWSCLFQNMELSAQQSAKSDICQEIVRYMYAHYLEAITLSSLAGALGYSKYHVSHIFREKFGCSFSDYLGRLRAEHAKRLLSGTDLSIMEICYASGFNSQRTFYRNFKRIYGQSPKRSR